MLPVTGNNLMIGSLLYVHLSPLYGTWYHEHNNLQKNVHETTEFLEILHVIIKNRPYLLSSYMSVNERGYYCRINVDNRNLIAMKTTENNYQKIKLLKIMEILAETDKDHAFLLKGLTDVLTERSY